jgi:hypothetical protein
MPDEDIRLALRTADQARTDFAIIEDELEAIHARLAWLPSRRQLWRVCLIGMLEQDSKRLNQKGDSPI